MYAENHYLEKVNNISHKQFNWANIILEYPRIDGYSKKLVLTIDYSNINKELLYQEDIIRGKSMKKNDRSTYQNDDILAFWLLYKVETDYEI